MTFLENLFHICPWKTDSRRPTALLLALEHALLLAAERRAYAGHNDGASVWVQSGFVTLQWALDRGIAAAVARDKSGISPELPGPKSKVPKELAKALASGKAVLTNLSVAGNNISGEAAQQLAAAALSTLEVLSDVPIKELREHKHTSLDLSSRGLGSTEGIVLAELLKGISSA